MTGMMSDRLYGRAVACCPPQRRIPTLDLVLLLKVFEFGARCPTSTATGRLCIIPENAACCVRRAVQWPRVFGRRITLAKVVEVLEDQSNRGQVLNMTEASARAACPGSAVASLGASRKDELGRFTTARVPFEGSNGIMVNKRTRIRDQEEAPTAADRKRFATENSTHEEPTLALTADVTEAHRQIPTALCHWYLLGCQVQSGSTAYINEVGTFGVASASYYWSRVASALGRL